MIDRVVHLMGAPTVILLRRSWRQYVHCDGGAVPIHTARGYAPLGIRSGEDKWDS